MCPVLKPDATPRNTKDPSGEGAVRRPEGESDETASQAALTGRRVSQALVARHDGADWTSCCHARTSHRRGRRKRARRAAAGQRRLGETSSPAASSRPERSRARSPSWPAGSSRSAGSGPGCERLSRSSVNRRVRAQRQRRRPLGQVLVRKGHVTDAEINRALADQAEREAVGDPRPAGSRFRAGL